MTCSGRSVGRRLSSTAAAALTCGAAKDVPWASRYSSGPQLEYPCSVHDGEARRQRPREDREDPEPRRRDVVVDPVSIRERRDAARVAHRAHAKDVRERRRVARVLPRAGRRLVRVPDRRDDDDTVRDRVRDRVGLEPGVRVALRVERVANPSEAHVDHPRAVVDRPADRLRLGLDRDRPRLRDDLRDQELRGRREPCDADAVVDTRADEPGDERPVPQRVGCAGSRRRSVSASRILPARSGCVASTPESMTATGIGSKDGSVGQDA